MTYMQLAEHAVHFQQSAVKAELAMRGYRTSGGLVLHDKQTQFEIETAIGSAQKKFAGVADIFVPFMQMPVPDDFGAVARKLIGVASVLNSGSAKFETSGDAVLANKDLGKIGQIDGLMDSWRGGAAIKFRDNFLSTWPAVTSNQFAVAMALKGAMEAERGLWTAARADVDQIAHQAQAALDAMLECNPKHIGFALTVAGSVLAVIALPVAAVGAAAAGSIVILSEAASSAGAFPFEDKKELPLSGGSVSEIVSNTQNALNALTRQIVDTENRIHDAIVGAIVEIGLNKDDFVAPRPALADMTLTNMHDGDDGLGEAEG